jgi:hypothetical protein
MFPRWVPDRVLPAGFPAADVSHPHMRSDRSAALPMRPLPLPCSAFNAGPRPSIDASLTLSTVPLRLLCLPHPPSLPPLSPPPPQNPVFRNPHMIPHFASPLPATASTAIASRTHQYLTPPTTVSPLASPSQSSLPPDPGRGKNPQQAPPK